MTLDDFKKITAAASGASWEHIHVFDGEEIIRLSHDVFSPPIIARARWEADGRFIVSARNMADGMINTIEAAKRLRGAGYFQKGVHPSLYAAAEAFDAALAAMEAP